jgi:hypothetical protein
VDEARRDVKRFPLPERDLAPVAIPFDGQLQLAGHNVEGFVFHFVVLQAERLALVHMQDLADVAVCVGKDQLVSPGLRDPADISRLEQVLHAHCGF